MGYVPSVPGLSPLKPKEGLNGPLARRSFIALADSGRLNEFFDLAQGYFARGIERRLTESKRLSRLPQRELGARASALAGSVLSLLPWWLDRGAKESPRAMDELFHRMVWNGLQLGTTLGLG